ncbi:MFS general substrate transporter [Periconia macrospinosa]|uniref:MFS general substrate transporter n=1 Tax=Periconia macrospinosa TaxID=97972 RepID=A0A2V1D5N5_9PLEO|nr:MFS general substrate transporter [Periconia macrospinosa]
MEKEPIPSDTAGHGHGVSVLDSQDREREGFPAGEAQEHSVDFAQDIYLTGGRLNIIRTAILMALFISQMESSVTSTAVLAITNDLGGYEHSPWLFTAYLLTYSGFPIIWAKISDIYGRKPCILLSFIIFLAFSGACGGAQSMLQLIMFRWVKGIGGSGIYSLGTLVFWELLPPEQWAANTSIVTGVLAGSLVVGPLVGGAITESGMWRWIFYINIPIITVASALLVVVFPNRLANEPAASTASALQAPKPSALRRVDIIGGLFLLGLCLMLTTGLQQAALGIPWSSSYVLPLLIAAAFFFIMLLLWSWYVTMKRTWPEPLFPWRFVTNRISLGMMLNAFLAGFTFTVTVTQLPQRFITVNGLSPLAAGVRLLPFGVMVPVGAGASAVIMDRLKIPPTYMCVTGSTLQVIGLVFLSRVSGSMAIPASQYGLQIIVGYGNGLIQTAVILLIPYIFENRDLGWCTINYPLSYGGKAKDSLGVANATIAQFRILGGVIGIAVTTTASTPLIRARMLKFLSTSQVLLLLDRTTAIWGLPSAVQDLVRHAFADGFNLQMRILIGIAAGHIVATALMWTKIPIRISRKGPA